MSSAGSYNYNYIFKYIIIGGTSNERLTSAFSPPFTTRTGVSQLLTALWLAAPDSTQRMCALCTRCCCRYCSGPRCEPYRPAFSLVLWRDDSRVGSFSNRVMRCGCAFRQAFKPHCLGTNAYLRAPRADMGVGKSCLLHQFTEKKCECAFSLDSHRASYDALRVAVTVWDSCVI